VHAEQHKDRPDIRSRSYDFALRVVKLVRALPRDAATVVIARQLARSATSVGANVEEAQGGQSRKDFAHKMNVARKEAGEAHYWLRLPRDTDTLPRPRLDPIVNESDEIVRILVTIVKTTRGDAHGEREDQAES
jgi:four helix bundle protein